MLVAFYVNICLRYILQLLCILLWLMSKQSMETSSSNPLWGNTEHISFHLCDHIIVIALLTTYIILESHKLSETFNMDTITVKLSFQPSILWQRQYHRVAGPVAETSMTAASQQANELLDQNFEGK